MPGNNQLGNPLPVLDLNFLIRQVNQKYFDFAPIVGIDGSGAIQYRDPVLYG